jgi:hypothetical protein
MTNLKNSLWCDLTTDAERSAWLLLGRGYETGVVAKAMQNDLARAYQRLAQFNHIADERKKVCPRCGKVNPAEIHTCSPQQRKWQWLTDQEVDEAAKERWVAKQSFEAGAWWANEKLREKNV